VTDKHPSLAAKNCHGKFPPDSLSQQVKYLSVANLSAYTFKSKCRPSPQS